MIPKSYASIQVPKFFGRAYVTELSNQGTDIEAASMSNEPKGEDHVLQYVAEMLAELEEMVINKVSPTSMDALRFAARLFANEADIDRIKAFRRGNPLDEA